VGSVIPQAFNADWIFWDSAELPPKPPPAPDGREPDGRGNDGRDPDGKDPDGKDPDGRDPLGNPPARPLGTVIPAALRHVWTLALPNSPPPNPRLADADALAEALAETEGDDDVVFELPPEQAAKPAVPRVRAKPSTAARTGRVMVFFLWLRRSAVAVVIGR
jgi:hypothetical protein